MRNANLLTVGIILLLAVVAGFIWMISNDPVEVIRAAKTDVLIVSIYVLKKDRNWPRHHLKMVL